MMIYRLVYLLVRLLLLLLHGVHPKLKKGYELRQRKNGTWPWLDHTPQTKPLWFHCASGEFEYALPLIRKIKEKDPSQKILVTYFTPSYLPRLSKEPLVDFYCPSPWDQPRFLEDFIRFHEPKALLIARTDIWQEMTHQCQRHKVPTLIFSMTFNKDLNSFSRLFASWQMRFIDRFFVVSEEDKEKLSRVYSAERIEVCGDTRYEQCLYRLKNTPASTKISKASLTKPLIVAGSLWPEDEAALLDTLKETKDRFHWVIVPHELHETELMNLKEKMEGFGTQVQFSKDVKEWNGVGVLIVNEFGLLAHLYTLATAAFVGGSFRRSVHSVMEPLAAGALTFVGPHYHNSREAEEFSQMREGFPLSPVQIVKRGDVTEKVLAGVAKWDKPSAEHLQHVFMSKARATDNILKKWTF